MKLLYITNIPAPYRQKRFNIMAEIFPKYEIDFEVLYMAKIEPNRKWIIRQESYNYDYKIFKGIHPNIGRFFAHFNPGLLFRLLKNDYDIAVIGGMASPTHWLAPFFISRRKFKIMSIESNLYSVVRKKGIGAKIKSRLLNIVDAYQVTGDAQIDYIKFFNSKSSNKKYIRMPNLIDEKVFVGRVNLLKNRKKELRSSFGINDDVQMWVIPARLIPIKGILPFIEAIKDYTGFQLFLLGDGEQKEEIKNFVHLHKIPVKFLGFVQQDVIVKYLAAADLFILPSFKDPSPLSPIEAIAAGLPVLLSKQIGNINEIMKKTNGWCFEPGNTVEIQNKVKSVLELSRDDLKKMGEESRKQYYNFFETESCVENYAKQIIEALKNV